MGEVILVASGKGGTGKSAIAVNMAATLANDGAKVILLDMNMGHGNLDLYLGLQNRAIYNVQDALSGLCKVRQAMICDERFECMYLMAASPQEEPDGITVEKVAMLYKALKGQFDYIIVDAPTGTGRGMKLAACMADRAVIVSTADYAGIRGAEAVDMCLREMEIEYRSYVLNRVKSSHTPEYGYPSFEDIGRILRGKVAGVIQEDEAIELSVNLGVPAVLHSCEFFADNMKRISRRVTRMK